MKKKELKKLKAAIMLSIATLNLPIQTKATSIQSDLPKYTLELRGKPYYGKELTELLNNLDENIQEKLNDENLKIVILDNKDGAEEAYRECGGYTTESLMGFNDKNGNSTTIYVEGVKYDDYYEKYPNSSKGLTEDDFYLRIAKDTLLQEIARYWNEKYGISNNQEMQNCFLEELDKFMQTTEFKIDNLGIYENVNTTEHYTTMAISCYISYPEELKQNCPKTYQIINSWFKEELTCGVEHQAVAEEQQPIRESYNILNSNIEIIGNPYYGQAMYDAISRITPAIQQYFIDRNVHILLLDGTESAENIWSQVEGFYPGSINGFTEAIDWEASRVNIYIEAGKYNLKNDYANLPDKYRNNITIDQFNYEIILSTLVHELGHAIDGAGIYIYSSTPEFINIFYEESNNFTNTREFIVPNRSCYSNISMSHEYFASSFEAFMMNDPDFPIYCPKTYNYFKNFTESLNETYGYTEYTSELDVDAYTHTLHK